MWWAVWFLVTVRAGKQLYEYDDPEQFSDDYDFYDEEEVSPSTPKYVFTVDTLTRVRRYGLMDHPTHDGYQIRDVKDALRQLFSGRRMENSYTFHTDSWRTDIEDNIISIVATRSRPYSRDEFTTLPRWSQKDRLTIRELKILKKGETIRIYCLDFKGFLDDKILFHNSLENNGWMRTRQDARRGWFPLPGQRSGRRQGNETTTTPSPETTTDEPTTTRKSTSTTASPTTTTPSSPTTTTTSPTTTTTESLFPNSTTTASPATTTTESLFPNTTTTASPATTSASASPNTTTTSSSNTTTTSSSNITTTTAVAPTTTTTTEPTNTTSTTTTTAKRTTKSTTPRFDIEALLDIVANLTYDYDTNLTEVLNETLQKFSIPTCRTPTTTVTTTTVTTTEVFYNTTVISKCFVCGLDIPGIPRNTFCSDAFATDFLPLVPIDPTAKGHIARFRKYCRYFDVNNYQLNRTDPRAMLGRWTGGCSVRWIDLSGVYTQRSCRNRLRPTTGLHFASKRMAKLELALSNVDDGCIISPMATLVPLSRGISLYARFHACVCTGNWCNRAILAQRWSSNVLYVLFLLFGFMYRFV